MSPPGSGEPPIDAGKKRADDVALQSLLVFFAAREVPCASMKSRRRAAPYERTADAPFVVLPGLPLC